MRLPAIVRARLPWFLRRAHGCSHIDPEASLPAPRTPGACEEWVKTGDSWVHFRLCTACGKVGRCDQSKSQHATRHFHDTGRPVVSSHQPSERWMWCHLDRIMIDG